VTYQRDVADLGRRERFQYVPFLSYLYVARTKSVERRLNPSVVRSPRDVRQTPPIRS
jgi:hypothetical protein